MFQLKMVCSLDLKKTELSQAKFRHKLYALLTRKADNVTIFLVLPHIVCMETGSVVSCA